MDITFRKPNTEEAEALGAPAPARESKLAKMLAAINELKIDSTTPDNTLIVPVEDDDDFNRTQAAVARVRPMLKEKGESISIRKRRIKLGESETMLLTVNRVAREKRA